MIKNIFKVVVCSLLFTNFTINAMFARTVTHLTQQIRNASQNAITAAPAVYSVQWYQQEAAKFRANGKQEEARLLFTNEKYIDCTKKLLRWLMTKRTHQV